MTSDSTELLACLRRMEGHLATLARASVSGRPQGKLTPKQRHALEVLLPTLISGSEDGGALRAADVLRKIEHQPAVVVAVLQGRTVDAGAAKKVGRLLGQAARTGSQVAGFRVQRGGDHGEGVMWSVIRVSVDFETPHKG